MNSLLSESLADHGVPNKPIRNSSADHPRILFVVTDGDDGGAQSHVSTLIERLSAEYHLFLCAGSDGKLLRHARSLGVQTRVLKHLLRPIKPIQDLRAILELLQIGTRHKARCDPRAHRQGRPGRAGGGLALPDADRIYSPRLGVLKPSFRVSAAAGLADGARDADLRSPCNHRVAQRVYPRNFGQGLRARVVTLHSERAAGQEGTCPPWT